MRKATGRRMIKVSAQRDDPASRWWFRPWYVKTWRVVLYFPKSAIAYVLGLCGWISRGCQPLSADFFDPADHAGPPNRRDALKFIYDMCRQDFRHDVGRWLTQDEWLGELSGTPAPFRQLTQKVP